MHFPAMLRSKGTTIIDDGYGLSDRIIDSPSVLPFSVSRHAHHVRSPGRRSTMPSDSRVMVCSG